LWTITRKDGTILRFTDHDADIIIGGVTYKAAVGYERTAVEANSNLAVGGMDVRGILDSTRIDENDLRAGRYDYADVEILLVDWEKFFLWTGTVLPVARPLSKRASLVK
jgi:uncharacterized phage protein (TIGR02218 family)